VNDKNREFFLFLKKGRKKCPKIKNERRFYRISYINRTTKNEMMTLLVTGASRPSLYPKVEEVKRWISKE